MLIWYAYRMDIMAFGAGSTLIAPDCIGTAPDGTCYFDEFLRYIERIGPNNPAWTGRTAVGTNLDPDCLNTADELANGGTAGTPSRYTNTVEPSKLFPNRWIPGDSPSFSDIFGAVVDNIQACRQKINDGSLDDLLDNSRRAIVSVLDAREADQAAKVLQGVNAELSKLGCSWVRDTPA